jgi:hypothetical protein
MEDELVEFAVAYKREELIDKIHYWAKFYLIATVITACFDFFNAYRMWIMSGAITRDAPAFYKAQYWASIFITSFYGIMLPIQAYFFYEYATKAKGIKVEKNGDEYNLTLSFLYKFALAAAILFVTNAIWAVIDMFSYL